MFLFYKYVKQQCPTSGINATRERLYAVCVINYIWLFFKMLPHVWLTRPTGNDSWGHCIDSCLHPAVHWYSQKPSGILKLFWLIRFTVFYVVDIIP